jgi:serine/threonine-protein kinase
VYAAGYDGVHFYLVMRYIDGPDLLGLLRREGPLAERRVLRLLGQIASALAAVHERNIVHRDIKPANVLLWNAGGADEHALLSDFGIAKALDESTGVTGVGAIGTPAYMAPEVCLGHAATSASDQYSLACLAYELLSGDFPYDASGAEFRVAHVEQVPIPLRSRMPGVSSQVANAVATALAKDPKDRFGDVRAFVAQSRAAEESFTRSQEMTKLLDETEETQALVDPLSRTYQLSDSTISELTGIDRAEIVRLKRRAAKRALTGRG